MYALCYCQAFPKAAYKYVDGFSTFLTATFTAVQDENPPGETLKSFNISNPLCSV